MTLDEIRKETSEIRDELLKPHYNSEYLKLIIRCLLLLINIKVTELFFKN